MFTWGQYGETMYWFSTDTPESLILATVTISKIVNEPFQDSVIKSSKALLAEGFFFPAKADVPRLLQVGKPFSPESRPYQTQLEKMNIYVSRIATSLWNQSVTVLKRSSGIHFGNFEAFMQGLLNIRTPVKVADFLLANQFKIGTLKNGSKRIICPDTNIPPTEDEMTEMLEYVTAAAAAKAPKTSSKSAPQ